MKRITIALAALALLVSVSSPAWCADGGSVAQRLAASAGITEAKARDDLLRVFRFIEAELKGGRKVTIRNFGTFYLQQRSARKGRNPATGQVIDIPDRQYPRFRSSDSLKRNLNAPEA